MTTPDPEDAIRNRTVELARRMQLLQDAVATERGSEYTFAEIEQALETRGISLSQRRWSYLVNGNGPLLSNKDVLTALAEAFEVDPEFLLEWNDPEMPDRVLAQRELIGMLRENKIENFAARSLGPLSPSSKRAIARIIREQMAQEFGEGSDREP